MPSVKWQRRKQARPDEILAAALELFAEKGFNATRVEDIAARAGVSKGTLYLYFDSKQAILRAQVRQGLAANLQALGGAVDRHQGGSGELIRWLLTAIGTVIANSPLSAIPKIIISESGNFPELAEFYRREVIDVGLGLMARIVERGVARGEFRAINPQYAAKLCMAPLLLCAIWNNCFARFDAEPLDVAAFIGAHLDVLLTGLAAGEKAQTP